MNKRRSTGFTLVEVMVALAVVAVALPALMMALYQQIDGTAYLRDKSLAHMVAANKLTEIRIMAEATRSLPEGSDSGLVELAERQWQWWRESKKTELENFYRIEIKVAQEEGQVDAPLVTLAAFLSADLKVEEPVEQQNDGETGAPEGESAGEGSEGESTGEGSEGI